MHNNSNMRNKQIEINTCKISSFLQNFAADSCLKNYPFSWFREVVPPIGKIQHFSRKWVRTWYTLWSGGGGLTCNCRCVCLAHFGAWPSTGTMMTDFKAHIYVRAMGRIRVKYWHWKVYVLISKCPLVNKYTIHAPSCGEPLDKITPRMKLPKFCRKLLK